MNVIVLRAVGSALGLAVLVGSSVLVAGCNTAPGDPKKNPYSGAPGGAPGAPGQPPASANYQNQGGPPGMPAGPGGGGMTGGTGQ